MVKLNAWSTVVGVPDTSPVSEFNVIPDGSEPALTVYVGELVASTESE